MELAARLKHVQKQFLTGRTRCIRADAGLSGAGAREVVSLAKDGVKIFGPTRGAVSGTGSAGEFKLYGVQDVQFMPKLWSVYRGRMSDFWWNEVLKENKARIQTSQHNDWKLPNMGLAPGH
jgi:hypothetical protein